jgi:membrane-bound lytic murein transglycosylase B
MKPILMIASLCLVASIALSAETTPDRPTLVTMTEEQAVVRLSPMLYQVRTALLEREVELAALEADLAEATDPAVIRGLERQVARAKEDAEIRIYRIQADHARTEGRETDAEHFEAMIQIMKKPAVVKDVPNVTRREEVAR